MLMYLYRIYVWLFDVGGPVEGSVFRLHVIHS